MRRTLQISTCFTREKYKPDRRTVYYLRIHYHQSTRSYEQRQSMQALKAVLSRRISLLITQQQSAVSCSSFSVFTRSYHWEAANHSLRSSIRSSLRKMSTVNWTPPAPGDIPAPPIASHSDIHSHANLEEIKPKHIELDWIVDWEKRTISGKVTHTIEVTREGVDQFVLDTSYLDIKSVSSGGEELKWDLGKRKNSLGSPLTIQLGSRKKGEEIKIDVEYSTTEQCTTLGWLTKE